MIEMYADPTSRGGIMEPEGVVGVKIKQRHYDALCKRVGHIDKNTLHQIAVHYADLHDTPGRMLSKQVIKGIVPLRESRRILGLRLVKRVIEVSKRVTNEDMVKAGYKCEPENDSAWIAFYRQQEAAVMQIVSERIKETRRRDLLAELASLE